MIIPFKDNVRSLLLNDYVADKDKDKIKCEIMFHTVNGVSFNFIENDNIERLNVPKEKQCEIFNAFKSLFSNSKESYIDFDGFNGMNIKRNNMLVNLSLIVGNKHYDIDINETGFVKLANIVKIAS